MPGAREAGVIEPLIGNKAIEDAAITFVVEQERRADRKARDMRYRGAAGDLESGERVIEVKAAARFVRSSGFLMLESRQVEEAKRNLSRTWRRATPRLSSYA